MKLAIVRVLEDRKAESVVGELDRIEKALGSGTFGNMFKSIYARQRERVCGGGRD